MKLLSLVICLACFTAVLALIPLKKQAVGNDYFIGKIWSLYFMQDSRILFRSQDDIMGFLNSNTGELQAVYQLDSQEKVVEFQKKFEVVIARGKSLNVFIPESENYMRLVESSQLQKLTFNSIIGFKRNIEHSYTLTDRFVVRMSFVPKNSSIIQKDIKVLVQLEDENEEFFNLFSYIQPKRHAVVLSSLLHGQSKEEVCFRLLDDPENIERKCLQMPAGAHVIDIVLSGGRMIYVEFEDSAWILNTKFIKIGQIDQGPQQYFNGLVVIGQDHKYYDPFSNTLYSTRIIEEQSPSIVPQLTMKVEEQSMLIESNSKDIVSIVKAKQQDPRQVWAQWNKEDKDNHRLYIQFQDNRLVCYKIMESSHDYIQLWEIRTQDAIKEKEGNIQAQENVSPDMEDTDKDIEGDEQNQQEDDMDNANYTQDGSDLDQNDSQEAPPINGSP